MKLTDILGSFGRSGLAALVAGGMACGDSGSSSSGEQTKGCVTDDDCHGGRKCEYNSCVYPALVFDGGEVPVVDKRELCDGWDNDNNNEIDEMGCGFLVYLTPVSSTPRSLRELNLATGVSRVIIDEQQIPNLGWPAIDPINDQYVLLSSTYFLPYDELHEGHNVEFGGLYYMNRFGNDTRKIIGPNVGPDLITGINYSPTMMGGKIIFSGNCYQQVPGCDNGAKLFTISRDGAGLQKLIPPELDLGWNEYNPTVGNGKIAFLAGIPDSPRPFQIGVYSLSSRTLSMIPIQGDAQAGSTLRWSADGTVIFGSHAPSNQGIYKIPVEGGVPELVARSIHPQAFTVSRDRTKLAFVGTDEGMFSYCVKDLITQQENCSKLFTQETDFAYTLDWVE